MPKKEAQDFCIKSNAVHSSLEYCAKFLGNFC